MKDPRCRFPHLAYLLWENEVANATTIDVLPDKCYSITYDSMIEELVERKSQRDTCAETDKVILYGYFETALTGGPLESTL